jgi:hypothetical protein
MQSPHLRRSIYDDKSCLSTASPATRRWILNVTLRCHRAPCGWVSRYEHIKSLIAGEDLRTAGLDCAFEVPMLIPHSHKRPGDVYVGD